MINPSLLQRMKRSIITLQTLDGGDAGTFQRGDRCYASTLRTPINMDSASTALRHPTAKFGTG